MDNPDHRKDSTAGAAEVECALPPADQTERFAGLMKGLLGRITQTTELANGYAVSFAADARTRADIDSFIAFEQGCCSFMSYAVTEDDPAQLTLALTGPEGTKAFLAKWIAKADADRRD